MFSAYKFFFLLGAVSSFVSRVNTIRNKHEKNFADTYTHSQLQNETETETETETEIEIEIETDPILKIGTFMGYPPEKKWKGFRIMIYSFSIGAVLREAVDKYFETQNEIQDFFSNS